MNENFVETMDLITGLLERGLVEKFKAFAKQIDGFLFRGEELNALLDKYVCLDQNDLIDECFRGCELKIIDPPFPLINKLVYDTGDTVKLSVVTQGGLSKLNDRLFLVEVSVDDDIVATYYYIA